MTGAGYSGTPLPAKLGIRDGMTVAVVHPPDGVRETGWVDVKVCAVDATWSGLKLVLRRELRPKG